jgi:hypothetical protein
MIGGMDERRNRRKGPIEFILTRILPFAREEPFAMAVLVFVAIIFASILAVIAGSQFISFR